jgi:hypothetical protein
LRRWYVSIREREEKDAQNNRARVQAQRMANRSATAEELVQTIGMTEQEYNRWKEDKK